MFLGYSELLNALDTGSTTKITINNKRLNRQNFVQEILIPRQEDFLDGYRAEYNSMLMDKVTDSSNSVVQERYITLSVHRKNVEEARDMALAIELFTEGSLNTFAKPSNVDTNSRILCCDIRGPGKQLLPVGMLVVLDSVFNQVIRNRQLGRNTWIYVDEIYLLFQHEYSASFLFTLWKRVRKYGACCTGITQNLDDLLQSHTARTMLANSEFLVMLNQAATGSRTPPGPGPAWQDAALNSC